MCPLFAPSVLADAIWEVDLEVLWAGGVRGLILDLDNTLVDWNGCQVRPQVQRWLAEAKEMGFGRCLVSNAVRGRRVKLIGAELDLLVVTWALKPLARGFRKAMELMGTTRTSTCAIGDQVFTDLLGANRLGMRTVLLEPLTPRESPHTRAIRLVERPLRRRWVLRQATSARPR